MENEQEFARRGLESSVPAIAQPVQPAIQRIPCGGCGSSHNFDSCPLPTFAQQSNAPTLTDADLFDILKSIDPLTVRLPSGFKQFARAVLAKGEIMLTAQEAAVKLGISQQAVYDRAAPQLEQSPVISDYQLLAFSGNYRRTHPGVLDGFEDWTEFVEFARALLAKWGAK